MRRIPTLMFLAVIMLLLAGCLHEKYDSCPMDPPQDNVTLHFVLDDGKGGCRLLSDVGVIDVAVYDDAGRCVMAKNVSQAELELFKGVTFTLPEGNYSVVAWGNIGANCVHSDMELIDAAHVTYRERAGGRVANTDKVFYAPSNSVQPAHCYEMDVDRNAGHTGTLRFMESHRTIQIYIEGYEGGMPGVELASLPEGLSWLGMNWLTDGQGSKRTVGSSSSTTSVDKDGTVYAYAEFDTFHFTADNGISVSLTDQTTGDTVFSITLNEALGDRFDPAAVIIIIKLKFTPSGVEVTIPDWKGNETEPGLG